VDSFKLENLTTAKINIWKKRYVEKAGTDPLERKRAERTANYYLRNSKALSGKRIIRQLSGVDLPEEIPFREVEYFRQSASRYHNKVNVEDLTAKASEELQEVEPEQFKIFILAIFVGLRRKEIDMLMWSAFDWQRSVIRVQHSEYHSLKSDASADDIPVEPEIMALFKAFSEEAAGEVFVIRSDRAPKISKSYRYYRAEKEFKALLDWLRAHGVESNKPIHTRQPQQRRKGSLVSPIRKTRRWRDSSIRRELLRSNMLHSSS
jgi:integrase